MEVGSLVRVPLGGRTTRGFVVETGCEPPLDRDSLFPASPPLKEVAAVLGGQPVFTPEMLPALRETARHYLAPLSAVLGRTAPPNLPRPPRRLHLPSIPPADSPAPEVSRLAAAGRPGPVMHLPTAGDRAGMIRGAVTAPLREGRSVMVIAPTAAEAAQLAHELRRDLGRRVAEAAGDAAALTEIWSRAAAQPGLAVVGTLRAMWWPVRDLALAVLVEEGRPGMKERRTPTVAAGFHIRLRARMEGFPALSAGPVAALESRAAGEEEAPVRGRRWPPVETADRRGEPPGGGVITERARIAIRAAADAGGPVLVFCHRRGYSPAARCASCRSLRICPECGSRPDPGGRCPRCGAELGGCPACGGKRFEPLGAGTGRVLEELARKLGGGTTGEADSGRTVLVGTERDLPELPPVRLAVVVDADGLVRRPDYRAAEEALLLLARVAGSLGGRRGQRMIIQTADPQHPVFRALQKGDPAVFLEEELALRRRLGLPPAGEMILLRAGGAADYSPLEEAMRDLPAGAAAHGPAEEADGGVRWLLQGTNLDPLRERLRPAIARIREAGGRVRADVDPRHL